MDVDTDIKIQEMKAAYQKFFSALPGISQEQMLDFIEFRATLSKESDRGCALYAASYLESALEALLVSRLVEDEKIQADLFSGSAPLSNFSDRIIMAYYIGAISEAVKRDLNLIRKIRNDFAHSAKHLSFTDPSVRDRCLSLYLKAPIPGYPARACFTSAVARILAAIYVPSGKSARPVKAVDPETDSDAQKNLLLRMLELVMPQCSE